MLEKHVDISNLLPCRELAQNFKKMIDTLLQFHNDLEDMIEDDLEDVALFQQYDREKIEFMDKFILSKFLANINHNEAAKYLQDLFNYCKKNKTMAQTIIANLTRDLTEDKETLFKMIYPKYKDLPTLVKIYKLFVADMTRILYVLASCNGIQKDTPMNIMHECTYKIN